MTDDVTSETEVERRDVPVEALGEAVADIISIRLLLEDNRPLEALRQAKEAERRSKNDLPDWYTEPDVEQ